MSKKGFTLLEMVLVLVIITSIILIAGRYFQQASEASKVSEATSKVRRIIEASYEWQKVNHTFEGIDMTELTTTGLLSESDTKGPWGKTFTIYSTRCTSACPTGVDIKLIILIPSVPNTACLSLKDIFENQNLDTSGFNCDNTQDQTVGYPKE